ncbi:MAG: hypothetical protein KAR62_00105 [Sphingomonadales bacterium]|nr:hypothetical protein [Sphingomonadales bacterium]
MSVHSLKEKLDNTSGAVAVPPVSRPTSAQKRYLQLGGTQPGGKLPLFDDNGQRIAARTIKACMKAGWCEPWLRNPIEPKWLVCKLTKNGKQAVSN